MVVSLLEKGEHSVAGYTGNDGVLSFDGGDDVADSAEGGYDPVLATHCGSDGHGQMRLVSGAFTTICPLATVLMTPAPLRERKS